MNRGPNYEILLSSTAAKEIRSLPPDVRRRAVDHIERLADEPRPLGVRKLQAADDAYRIRVGDYRVIFTVDDAARIVFISHVRHRGDAYR